MATDWQPATLDDLVEIKHGFAFQGEFFHDEPPGDVLLTPGNFAIGGGFKGDKLKFYREGPVPEDFVLAEDDLLVTMTDLSKGVDTLGYPALVPLPREKRRFLHNQRLGKVIIKPDAPIEKRFLYYVLCTREYRNEVIASATGTTVKHTSPSRIGKFQFKLPGRDEQRAIARVLGALDDRIQLNSRVNATLENISRAIFKSWFVDFDPVCAKVEGHEQTLPNTLWELFPDSLTEYGKIRIPRSWAVQPVGDLATISGGSTPSTKEPDYWNGGTHHWATPKDLASLGTPVLLDTERKITDAGLGQISSGLLAAGTVLMSSRAPIGYLAVAEVPVAINQGFIAMQAKPNVSNLFLLRWAEWAHDLIVSHANGSTFLEISKSNFRPMLVVTPPESLMREFDRIVRPLYSKLVCNEVMSKTLVKLRDTLLPRLMSGQVRIADVERLLGGEL